MPYASYVGLVGAVIVLVRWLTTYPQAIGHRLRRQGWIWLILGLGLSIILAEAPVQAALKSTNFWPFFIFFAGLSVYLDRLPDPLANLGEWAFWLLMASIPINLRAFIEYLPALAIRVGAPLGLAEISPIRQRVDSVFGNPNVLAAYLVIIFGLGLGLCLQALPLAAETLADPPASGLPPSRRFLGPLKPSRHRAQMRWIYGAMALIPLGVFCTGSRNGVLVLLIQLAIAVTLVRRHRWAMCSGLGLITMTIVGVFSAGFGGRSFAQTSTASILRLDIWELSLPLIQQHPWFGLGFGGTQATYEPHTIPHHATLHHVHNLWLHLAAEAGLPVMLLLTAIVGSICYRAMQAYRLGQLPPQAEPMLVGYGLGFLACILFAMSDIVLFDARVNLLGWLMLAALQAIPDGVSPVTLAQPSALLPPIDPMASSPSYPPCLPDLPTTYVAEAIPGPPSPGIVLMQGDDQPPKDDVIG
ncbi:hypothetical protein GFS31_27100 [Leptolyngbya sp. BL0902]|nr:hypothetical protein GFS31_27100 [Leptolyngbya sp. BL0902]